jgi:hypothetical protein
MESDTERSAGSRRSHTEIHIDIPGVTADSKLADLTVEQFVRLLFQVSEHIRPRRTQSDRRKAEAVRRLIRILGSDNEHVAAIRGSLGEIVKELPQIMRDWAQEMRKDRA